MICLALCVGRVGAAQPRDQRAVAALPRRLPAHAQAQGVPRRTEARHQGRASHYSSLPLQLNLGIFIAGELDFMELQDKTGLELS